MWIPTWPSSAQSPLRAGSAPRWRAGGGASDSRFSSRFGARKFRPKPTGIRDWLSRDRLTARGASGGGGGGGAASRKWDIGGLRRAGERAAVASLPSGLLH